MHADIGLIGLAVMGQNLVLNMADHGFTVAVYNRTVAKVEEFIRGPARQHTVIGAQSFEDFFKVLKRPRKVLLMVKAGQAVDDLIEQCLPYLEKGDIIIDGGNSHYPDTERRVQMLQSKGFHFLGVGISGGEEGARRGPSIMPGGDIHAWPHVKPIFQAIAARSDDNEPCCEWVGEGGAGHYVKMVHNGIEYGDMQLICEAYDLMSRAASYSAEEMAEIFSEWNKGVLKSYLIEITAHILRKKDTDGLPLVDKILDVAAQKGTGKWTLINACDLATPLTLIGEAVFARMLSSLYDERKEMHRMHNTPIRKVAQSKQTFVQALEYALYASKIMSYAQGFMLMREAAKAYNWKLNYGSIALMWRSGCIIRSTFLGKIKEAFDKNQKLSSLLIDPYFSKEIQNAELAMREIIAQAALSGVPTPCMSSALSFYDGLRSNKLPANLLQAQRDFFGAHTYERTKV